MPIRKLFGKLLKDSNVKPRQEWEAHLTWYRLRYENADGPVKAINLLSRTNSPGRVSLYYEPGDVTRLYLGIPGEKNRLLNQMAGDYGFLLAQETPQLPKPTRLVKAIDLPVDRLFVAHIANEYLFVSTEDDKEGEYLPMPPSKQVGHGTAAWKLPSPPPAGITSRPSWERWTVPQHWIATFNDPQTWVLGRSKHGPLHLPDSLNVYGKADAACVWLAGLLEQSLADGGGNIVVIDGVGELARKLKRKATITNQFNRGLMFIDMDGVSARGFNPLAPISGVPISEDDLAVAVADVLNGVEVNQVQVTRIVNAIFNIVGKEFAADHIRTAVTRAVNSALGDKSATVETIAGVVGKVLTDEATKQRWLDWFTGMKTRHDALALLPTAYEAGVRDLFALRRWLNRQQKEHFAAVSRFRVTLDRILESAEMGAWLKQPFGYFKDFPGGSLIFTCEATSWERQQLLRAVLLAALQLPNVRLAVHGYPWEKSDNALARFNGRHRAIISNGPSLDVSVPVLVECRPEALSALADRFLGNDPLITENYQLLRRGDALVVHEGTVTAVTWKRERKDR